MRKTLNFKTNTLLKNLVGKDLINDDNIAIVELVKNAYDAGSESVLVRFDSFSPKGVSTNSSQIVIADKGCGMGLVDIRDKWLNIAYSEKKLTPQENGAYLAGNKGIGRFSCDRLGEKLDLLTRTQDGELLHLRINWPDFEVEGKVDLTIQEINLVVTDITEPKAANLAGLKTFPTFGTVLVISNLRSEWDREKLFELKDALERFINPNQLFLRNKFRITFRVPDFKKEEEGKDYPDKINVEIKNQIFEKLEFNSTYIDSRISPKDGTITTELHHDGEAVFKLVEHNTSYPLLRDARVVIYYLNPYKKSYFKRQTGVRSVDFGSVFLFLNGFRIAPYGDRGDDWLGLDVRKAQGTTRYLSSRDVVGRIEIKGSEEQFKPISSREGLKKTDAFVQLREVLFIEVLKRLERFVVDGLNWDSVPEALRPVLKRSEGLDWKNTTEQYAESRERKNQRIALSIMTLVGASPEQTLSFWFNPALLEEVYQTRTEEVKYLLAEIEGIDPIKVDADLKRGLSKVRALIAEKEDEAKAAKSEAAELRITATKLRAEKDTYQAQTLFLQSVSSLDAKELVAFHHQIVHDSSIISNYIGRSIKTLQKLPGGKEVLGFLEKAALANNRITAVAQFATKANFRAGLAKEPTDLPAFIEQYITNVAKEFVATNLRVVVENKVREKFELKISRVEMSILIDNIISNADKADAKNLEVKILKVGGNTLRISFADNGNGLSSKLDKPESMFEMGVTTTSGSGLGLYHARDIVEKIGGKINAIPQQPRGMEIRVEVTR
jgi:signal transduction histidine kinase/anti-sigma regulatory factor (Ser/Thr protein kinase)